MTRSPLFYPLNRGMDAEAGGVADLQTDVMRFIAILALCLVAIFALVQSIPLLPSAVVASPSRIAEADPLLPEPVVAEPFATEPVSTQPPDVEAKPLIITRPAPRRIQRREVSPVIIEQAVPAPPIQTVASRREVSEPPETAVVEKPVPEPPVTEPAPATEQQGFTLRFETDMALTRLVARNEVGLYAITPDKSVRMNVNRGAFSFWPASVPNQFHEMDEATVPDDVLVALRRAGSVKTSDVSWGVTLPSGMRRQLDQYLSAHEGGSLIISGDGNLRLEP
jgi:hypothetical protein